MGQLSLFEALRRRFCSHVVVIRTIERRGEEVEAPCARCGAPLRAPYGLALPAQLVREFKR